MRRSEWIVPLVAIVLSLVVLPLPAVQENGPVLLHQPVTAFERSSDLEIKVQALRKVKWVTLFYRFKADGEFVAQPLESPEKNLFRTSLATAQIPERQFEYYLACKSGGRVAYFPADVPEHFYSVKEIGEGPLPTPGAPAAEKGGFVFKVNLGGDLQGKVSEKTESTTDTVANTDQIGLTAGYKKEKFSLLADARTRVDTDPLSGENRLDLADLCVTLTHRSQMLRIGDISASESEFSLNTFGQRGMDYTFDNQQLYLHVLALNTQQLRGFKGFGIPRAATALYGGAAGVSFLNQTLSLKTVFLTGQDDPGQALNTGFTPYQYQTRQGICSPWSAKHASFRIASASRPKWPAAAPTWTAVTHCPDRRALPGRCRESSARGFSISPPVTARSPKSSAPSASPFSAPTAGAGMRGWG